MKYVAASMSAVPPGLMLRWMKVSLSLVRFRCIPAPLPILKIKHRQVLVSSDDQHVFPVLLFRRLRKIKAACDDIFLVKNHHLAVGNGKIVINADRNSGVHEKCGRRIFFGLLALIKYGTD